MTMYLDMALRHTQISSPSAEQLSLATPTFLRTEQGTSPPLLTSLSKEDVGKLGIVSRHDFWVTPPALADNSDADDEGAGDELSTESDLETHADDEASDYSANAEEDDEGHPVLRFQLKNVAIKKRTHAETEDAKEEKDGSSKDGSAKKQDGDDGDSSQLQETSILPMTEQEKGGGRNGKKARTGSSGSPQDLLFPLLSSPVGTADSTTGNEGYMSAK